MDTIIGSLKSIGTFLGTLKSTFGRTYLRQCAKSYASGVELPDHAGFSSFLQSSRNAGCERHREDHDFAMLILKVSHHHLVTEKRKNIAQTQIFHAKIFFVNLTFCQKTLKSDQYPPKSDILPQKIIIYSQLVNNFPKIC